MSSVSLRRFVLADGTEGIGGKKESALQFTIIQYLLSKMNLDRINDLRIFA